MCYDFIALHIKQLSFSSWLWCQVCPAFWSQNREAYKKQSHGLALLCSSDGGSGVKNKSPPMQRPREANTITSWRDCRSQQEKLRSVCLLVVMWKIWSKDVIKTSALQLFLLDMLLDFNYFTINKSPKETKTKNILWHFIIYIYIYIYYKEILCKLALLTAPAFFQYLNIIYSLLFHDMWVSFSNVDNPNGVKSIQHPLMPLWSLCPYDLSQELSTMTWSQFLGQVMNIMIFSRLYSGVQTLNAEQLQY